MTLDTVVEAQTVHVEICPGCAMPKLQPLLAPESRRIFVTDGPEMVAQIGVAACASCGLIVLNPRLSGAALAEYYGRQSRMPRASIPDDTPIARMIDSQIDFITAATKLDARSTALEIGCAEGYFLERLGKRVPGIARAGVEPSARYAREARERLPNARIVEDILEERIRERLGEFDVIVIRHVLEHLPEPVTDLHLMRRLMRPSGVIYIEVPDVARIPPAVCQYFHHEHLTYFSRETLEACLLRAGLRTLVIELHQGYEHGSGFAYPVLRVLASPGETGRPLNHPAQPSEIWRRFRENEQSFLQRYLQPARQRLDGAVRAGKRLALFGAGPHTVDVLDRLPSQYPWVMIFDNHPGKTGKRLCGIPIALPTREALAAIDSVFVSSLEYEPEMIEQLRTLGGGRIDIIPLYTADE